MGDLSEFPAKMRLFLRAYPWRRIDPVPWTPLRRPLAKSKLALISSAGFAMPDQERFDESRRGGDPSFREIPGDADPAALVDCHRSQTFDHSGMDRDPNLAFPLDRSRELVASGRIGSLARRHLSFMGSITAPGRLTRQTAPAAVAPLIDEDVDVALLVPV
jgi:D-proline reductase (dithiol) PrdB